MKKNHITISFIMILFLAVSTIGIHVKGTFNIFYVDDDNIEGPWYGTIEYPFRYIQDAIGNASYGDTIRVYEGVYSNPENNINITKTLSFIGNGSTETFIECPISIYADAVFFKGFNLNQFELIYSDMCNINNNTIKSYFYGIELYNSHNNTIEYNIIEEYEQGKPSIYFFSSNSNLIRKNQFDSCEFGIYVDYCQDIVIDDNNFRNCDYSISLISSEYCIIKNNTIQNGENGINIYSSNNNLISENTIWNMDYDSIIFSNSNYNNIIENIIANNLNGLEIGDSSHNNTINRNKITNNINSIFIDGSNNVVSENIISNNLRGLYLGDSSHSNIISCNNILSNNEYGGIRASGSYNHILNNNILYNGDGILCNLYSSKDIESNNYTIIGNNITSNHGAGIELTNCSFYIITDNTISNNKDGIELRGSRYINISGNNIHSNDNNGILFYSYNWRYSGEHSYHHFPFINNQIIGNLISDNGENGIFLSDSFRYRCDSRNNTICENNIINNKRDAYIVNAFLNRWQNNYWTNGRFLPKLIFGKFQIFGEDFNIIEFAWVEFPWIKFDWHPAIKPYNIEV